ncbi:putative flagellar apparatus related protein [Desulforapulum autotrophicum HRM2]|uniref:Flagellar apparatus related protein n=1 Tax=Desulforapulum autotrophicum (strain ATCC 43914 / DSM 3382 / VKM B-1955 / HRM2) TaxID=177437 RepID=C0QA37_DESAH|nr:flagellar protein FlgN [Desulforapulum autotrophicum]ACN16755.1 putative flagellar apparatus related protein [Desulforapulum autotrophicum HRM2]
MEHFTDRLETLIHEKLVCYRQLTALLEADRQAILAMDVDSLWRITTKKNEIARQIERLRCKLLEVLDLQGIVHSMEPASFRLSTLVSLLSKTRDRARIEAMKIAIDAQKDEIQGLASENKRYINDYLKVVGDVMSTIVKMSGQDQYAFSGKICEGRESNHFIRAKV